MKDQTQNPSSLNFANANKTNKKSQFYNHKQKDSKKRLFDVTANKNNPLYSYKELLLYGHTQTQFLKFLPPLKQLKKIRNFTPTYKKTTKNNLSTSQRLKTNLCTRKEHSYVYDRTQKQFFKISE